MLTFKGSAADSKNIATTTTSAKGTTYTDADGNSLTKDDFNTYTDTYVEGHNKPTDSYNAFAVK